MTKCPSEYKNLGIETFGNKKKVTVEMLTQFCKNDSYLYSKVKELFDLTDPESRKRYFPPFKDDAKSVNIANYSKTNEVTTLEDNIAYYGFDDSTEKKINISSFELNQTPSFEDYIDLDKSTIEIDTKNGYAHIPLTDYETTLKWDEIESKTISTKKTVYGKAKKDSYYEGPYGKFAPNGTWYCGYNYTKTYSIKQAWKKDYLNQKYKIPCLSRAETFKALQNGKLDSITINVKADKKTNYPLIIELRTTDKKGYPTNKVLARSSKKFNHTGMALEAFTFKTTVDLKKGTTYAIVMRCPLAPYSASYHVAGWQQMCYTKTTKTALTNARKNVGVGYSFESTDNCNTWLKYNHDKSAGYKNSGKNPVAFGYEVKICPSSTTGDTEEVLVKTPMEKAETVQARAVGVEYHLYFKPMRYEKIKQFTSFFVNVDNFNTEYCEVSHHISSDGKNWYKQNDNTGNTGINYIFTDKFYDYLHYRITMKLVKREESWKPQKDGTYDYEGYYNEGNFYEDSTHTIEMIKVTDAYYKDKITTTGYRYNGTSFVKSKPLEVQSQKIDDSSLDNPRFKGINMTIDYTKPTKAYCRSIPYVPNLDEMLPPCIWAECGTDYDKSNTDTVEIDVVRDITKSVNCKFVTPTLENLRGYSLEYDSINNKLYYASDSSKTDYLEEYEKDNGGSAIGLPTTDVGVKEYVESESHYSSLLKWLYEKHNIFVIGIGLKKNNAYVEYNTSFSLYDYLAFPVVHSSLEFDNLYLLSDDFISVKNSSNYYLYSSKINNFEQQIKSVEIVKYDTTSESFEVAKTLSGASSTSLKDQMDATAVQGYYHNLLFYIDSSYTMELTPQTNRYYINLNASSDADKYYIYNGTYYELVPLSSITPHWEISSEENYKYQLKINYDAIGTDKTTYFTISEDTLKLNPQYSIRVNFNDNDMIEEVDYTVDYDNKLIRFYNENEDDSASEYDNQFLWSYDTFHTGNFVFEYNPLWVRGLTSDDLPIRMDLWIDYYKRSGNTIKHISFEDDGSEKTLDTYYYDTESDSWIIKTSVDAVDDLRQVVINEDSDEPEELMEDSDFTVDYISNEITIPNTTTINDGDYITVRYTPDIREFGLSVAYRLYRDNTNKNSVKLKNYYFTTRT